MTEPTAKPNLTPALEDYLETIFRLARSGGIARVRDIAEARSVRPASVSPALRRLDEAGLIRYERREYVGLTDEGVAAARRVYARHQVLRRFFGSFLGLPADIAEADACMAEHSLSPETLDSLVRLFEYMEMCPEGREHLRRFHSCARVQDGAPVCPNDCEGLVSFAARNGQTTSLADLAPGQKGRVRQVEGHGDVRQRLLDMGLLPDATVTLVRMARSGDPLWIELQGFELSLRRSEAEAVVIERA